MFCPNCGTRVPDGAAFCPNCGTHLSVGAPFGPSQPDTPTQPQQGPSPQQPYQQQPQYQQQPLYQQQPYQQQPQSPQQAYSAPYGGQYTDFSPLVDDPQIQAKIKKDAEKTKKLANIMSLLPIVIGVAAGFFSKSVEISQGLTIGVVVSVLMFILSRFSKKNPNGNERWEGTVVDKEKKDVYVRGKDSREKKVLIHVKRTDGKKETIQDSTLEIAYNYFHVGDYIRYVPGFNFPYEKKNKSQDGYTICMFCSRQVDLSEEYCPRCHSRVIK